MKKLASLVVLICLSACTSIDPQVQLIGEYSDHKDQTRYEVYVRKVSISEPSRLRHRDEPIFLADSDTKRFVVALEVEKNDRSVTESAVKKDIEAGRRLRLLDPK